MLWSGLVFRALQLSRASPRRAQSAQGSPKAAQGSPKGVQGPPKAAQGPPQAAPRTPFLQNPLLAFHCTGIAFERLWRRQGDPREPQGGSGELQGTPWELPGAPRGPSRDPTRRPGPSHGSSRGSPGSLLYAAEGLPAHRVTQRTSKAQKASKIHSKWCQNEPQTHPNIVNIK